MKLLGRFFLDCLHFFDKRFVLLMHAFFLFLVIVVIVAEDIDGRGLFAAFDEVLLERIVDARTDLLSLVMRGITAFGHWMIVSLFVGIAALELAARRKTIQFTALLLSVGGASLVAFGLKQFFVRPRPELLPIVSETTFSFPSGHSALSLALYGILIYFLLRCACERWMKFAGVAVGIAVILAVGFSRIYLGVHWPSDVLGGYLLTAGWLVVVIVQAERMERRRRTAVK